MDNTSSKGRHTELHRETKNERQVYNFLERGRNFMEI